MEELASRCAGIEKELADESTARETAEGTLRADVASLTASHKDGARTILARHQDLGRTLHEEREARERDHLGVRGVLRDLERRNGDIIRDLAEDLSEKHGTVRARITDVDTRCNMALNELTMRLGDLEQTMTSHTHELSATRTYRCGPPVGGCATGGYGNLGRTTSPRPPPSPASSRGCSSARRRNSELAQQARASSTTPRHSVAATATAVLGGAGSMSAGQPRPSEDDTA